MKLIKLLFKLFSRKRIIKKYDLKIGDSLKYKAHQVEQSGIITKKVLKEDGFCSHVECYIVNNYQYPVHPIDIISINSVEVDKNFMFKK